MTNSENEKGEHMYWLTHGNFGIALATGWALAAVLLVVYNPLVAGIAALITAAVGAAVFVFWDRPRRLRELERTAST